MARDKSKTAWKKQRAINRYEKAEHRYYIFCEGQRTEPDYFEGLKRDIEKNPIYKNMVMITIEGCQAETLRVVDAAEKYVKKNKLQKGQIYCVYDKDSFPPEHFNEAANKINQLNKNHSDIQYHAAWSNECFELWFILHFANYTSNNGRQHYIEFLNREFKKRNLGKYDKTADNYVILNEHGNPKNAIRYAENLLKEGEGLTPAESAPATKVHELVKELAKYLPDGLKEKYL